jgi:hypothetical protein
MTTSSPLHNSWNRKVVIEDIAALVAHPLSVKIYGEPVANEELLTSVEKLGVLTPVTIDHKNRILSGTSRHYASSVMHQKFPDGGFNKIPTVLFTGTELEGELLVVESNRQRVKVASQLGREFNERFRIEQEFAKLRQAAGVPLKSAEGGDARDKAAKAVNLGRSTAEKIGKLARKADEGNQKARHLLHAIDNGHTSISAAFTELESKGGAKPADCPMCEKSFPSLTQLYKHGRHDHKIETVEMQKRLGVRKPEPPTKYDSAPITNGHDLDLKALVLLRKLAALLPSVDKSDIAGLRAGAENVFVRDMGDVRKYLSKNKADLKGGQYAESDIWDSVELLRRTLLWCAEDLRTFADSIPRKPSAKPQKVAALNHFHFRKQE